MKKEKIFRILTLVFTVLTFIGAGYVLINKGEVNAGYAAIPCLFSENFSLIFRWDFFYSPFFLFTTLF